jgi:hypothetical protein
MNQRHRPKQIPTPSDNVKNLSEEHIAAELSVKMGILVSPRTVRGVLAAR